MYMEKIIPNPFLEVKVLFFYFIIAFAIILNYVLFFSRIGVKVESLKISSEKKQKISNELKIIIFVYVLKKIKILKITISKRYFDKVHIENIININKLFGIKPNRLKSEKVLKIIKEKTKIDLIKLFIEIGTEDAAITSYLVFIIFSILGITLRKIFTSNNDNLFLIDPIYGDKNVLNLDLNCIFSIKMIHIIYIIYILCKKRSSDKYDRTTSYRGPYGYSYE